MSHDDEVIEYVTNGAYSLSLNKGQTVILRASNPPAGQTFKKWLIEPSRQSDKDDGVTPDASIDNATNPVAKVTMGSIPATIKAVYEVDGEAVDPSAANQLSVESGKLYQPDSELEKTIKDLEAKLKETITQLQQEKGKISKNFKKPKSSE